MGIPIKDFAAMLAARGEEVAAKDVAALLLDIDKQADVMEADLARVTAERDAALAEVEAMREVADKLAGLLKGNHVGHGAFPRSGCGVCRPVDAALDAIRTRKGGG